MPSRRTSRQPLPRHDPRFSRSPTFGHDEEAAFELPRHSQLGTSRILYETGHVRHPGAHGRSSSDTSDDNGYYGGNTSEEEERLNHVYDPPPRSTSGSSRLASRADYPPPHQQSKNFHHEEHQPSSFYPTPQPAQRQIPVPGGAGSAPESRREKRKAKIRQYGMCVIGLVILLLIGLAIGIYFAIKASNSSDEA